MRSARWPTLQRLFVTVGSSIIVLIFASLTYAGIVREQEVQSMADHSDSVIRAIDIALARIADAQAGQRGYLLSANEQYLAAYEAAESDVKAYLARLDTLTRGDPAQHARLDSLTALVTERILQLDSAAELRRTSGLDAALTTLGNTRGGVALGDARRLAAVSVACGASGDSVWLRVADTGRGISPEKL